MCFHWLISIAKIETCINGYLAYSLALNDTSYSVWDQWKRNRLSLIRIGKSKRCDEAGLQIDRSFTFFIVLIVWTNGINDTECAFPIRFILGNEYPRFNRGTRLFVQFFMLTIASHTSSSSFPCPYRIIIVNEFLLNWKRTDSLLIASIVLRRNERITHYAEMYI